MAKEQLQQKPRLLAQLTPSSNAAVSAVKKGARTRLSVTSVVVVNTTSSAATYSLYADADGNTYTAATALAYNAAIAANTAVDALTTLNHGAVLDGRAAGNFAVQSNTANALTFTVYGFDN